MRANEESLFDILGTKCSWFRMSNISYPEISDSQKAVEELRMAEYFRSLEFTKEPSKTDIREVLDLLTVSELREISTLVLSKVDIPIQQSYLWYGSSIGDKDPQVPLKIVRGPLVDLVHQQFNLWIYQLFLIHWSC
ncbi:uncharacterized protein LOC131246332 isoform X9 [Magnolia sinica]|uniref:uncharacterized protein LOC131246332 isoform X9 n=1 Tax=Magnolia sinica TaxID=86752 RepID=UPI002659A026|nr:uncharacterized protein LOC131246332 isoform X9 [Magnolia sinica]